MLWTTILTTSIFGISAVAAMVIIKSDHRTERQARKQAIDEAIEPWRELYAYKEEELAKMQEQHEQTVAAFRRELRRADQEIARWNVIAMSIKGKDLVQRRK